MAIPSTRVPGRYTEIDNSRAVRGPVGLPYKALIIGQGTDAGTATVKELTRIFSESDASSKFGRGSMIHRQAKSFLENNQNNELWAIAATLDPLATPTNKATGSIQITGPATAAGTLVVYVAGDRSAQFGAVRFSRRLRRSQTTIRDGRHGGEASALQKSAAAESGLRRLLRGFFKISHAWLPEERAKE